MIEAGLLPLQRHEIEAICIIGFGIALAALIWFLSPDEDL